jgi:hypothetical protein
VILVRDVDLLDPKLRDRGRACDREIWSEQRVGETESEFVQQTWQHEVVVRYQESSVALNIYIMRCSARVTAIR